jgi:hypothetical protein
MNDINTMTPDDINDAIRDHIECVMPRPPGGFASADDSDDHRAACDAEFLRLQWLSESELAAIITR